jgi:exodeoxyribonuclease III
MSGLPRKPAGACRLVSWNVNGLRSILGKGFLGFLENCDADMVCLQEIKARPDQVAEVVWPAGWELHWNPAQRPGYSGVMTLTRHKPGAATCGIGREAHDSEGRVLALEFPGFHLVNVYVPNSQRELTRLGYRTRQWSPDFSAYLQSLRKTKPVVLCGDMNVAHEEIDLARPKDNTKNAGFTPEERECFRQLLAEGFIDSFRVKESGGGFYTWWSYQNQARPRNIGWRIDYFLLSEDLRTNLRDAHIWPQVAGSDHCPVAVDLEGVSL